MPINRFISPAEDTAASVDAIVQRLFPQIHQNMEERAFFEELIRSSHMFPFNLSVVEGIPRESLLDPDEHLVSENLHISVRELKHPEEFEVLECAQYMLVPYDGKEVMAVTPLYTVERRTRVVRSNNTIQEMGTLWYDNSRNTFIPLTRGVNGKITAGKPLIVGERFLDPVGVSQQDLANARAVLRNLFDGGIELPKHYRDENFNMHLGMNKQFGGEELGNVLVGYYTHSGHIQSVLLPNTYRARAIQSPVTEKLVSHNR